jgi:hypothetical protein
LLKKILSGLILCAALAACDAPPAVLPETSLWGAIDIAGRAPQSDAPALAVDDTTGWRMLAWTGVAEGEARLFARHATSGEVKILALKAYQPYNLTLYPAGEAKFHLLWLDRTADSIMPTLHAALINAEASAEVSTQDLSDSATYHYAAAVDSEGGLRVVWSSGLLSEPDLYTRLIDGKGRPTFPVKLLKNADYPAVIQSTDGVLVFWLAGDKAMRGTLFNDALSEIAALTDTVTHNPGDRLAAFSAALDMTQGYLSWQVIRASGLPEAWLATGAINRKDWSAPAILSLPPAAPGDVETGFNTGAVNIALPIPDSVPIPVQWAAPLSGQFPSVPVVVYAGDSLTTAYLRWGSVAGYQTLFHPPELTAAPLITSDRNNHLYVSWSQPAENGVSEMRVTGTR